MNDLVVVSNRLPPLPEMENLSRRTQEVGGLVTALLSALEMKGGGTWFGWSGKYSQGRAEPEVTWNVGKNRIVGIHLSEREVDAYYNGFCNRALWPLLHSFQGRVHLNRAEERIYQEVNSRFAQLLSPHIKKSDTIWVNDYHLFFLGRELRRLGHKGPIGFFLHVPFPPYDIWHLLPNPAEVLQAMAEYDLVGFHTRTYRDNYIYAFQRFFDASWDGTRLRSGGHRQKVGIFPIGVDAGRFSLEAATASTNRRRRGLKVPGEERRIIIGVDRLDYTKGIPDRIRAFETLLRNYSQYRGNVSMFQICAPSRTRVPEYVEQKRTVETLVGRINGEFAEHDWVPVSYLYRSYSQNRLSLFYRNADVCLVTPLRDGMNLVAKEYVASQNPENPGVLVLSRFAGAAEELGDAVLVNPYLPDEVADGLHKALSMPADERAARHNKMFRIIEEKSVEWWVKTFLNALTESRN